MPIAWPFPTEIIELSGIGRSLISHEDAQRQTETVKSILNDLNTRPGVLLSDEVGMGKTYVAMAVIASVIVATQRMHSPVVVMVPPGLRQKWQRDWELFKTHCVKDHALNWVQDKYAHTPLEFFKLLDDRVEKRVHLIFITTGCFSSGFNDPWVKLAMIRLARSYTKLTNTQKDRLCRWAADLVRQSSNYRLTEKVIHRLIHADVYNWKRILLSEGILTEDDYDPVPDCLPKEAAKIDWTPVCDVIREIPGKRPEYIKTLKRNVIRQKFSEACGRVYRQWFNLVHWRSPLLILDEAHHAKNDSTYLARLFRQESENDVALLKDKFDRMLFLTATPFQLGHQELIRILRSFAAVRWSCKETPNGTRESFLDSMAAVEQALDRNRLATRRFDQLWGKLHLEMIGNRPSNDRNEEQQILQWWRKVETSPSDTREQHLVQAYRHCSDTREEAERLLKPWIIRHNRSLHLPGNTGVLRRNVLVGKAILTRNINVTTQIVEGISIEPDVLLPFLITARAQGQLAQHSGTRAYFAEGLSSSYEAFHHTREDRKKAKDFEDGLQVDEANDSTWMIPMSWYEEQIAKIIPSRKAPRIERMSHPKISATVEKTVDLWFSGEKVLVFCFYVETAHALYEHIREEVNKRIIKVTSEKLNLDYQQKEETIKRRVAKIVRRLAAYNSPFHREIKNILENAIDQPQYHILRRYRDRLLGVLMAYFRSPSFVARYLPLADPLVREAFEERKSHRDVIARGVSALRYAILEEKDASNQTYLGRIDQFLAFVSELAERAERRLNLKRDEFSDESENPLLEYLDAISVYSKPRRPEHADVDEVEDEAEDGSYRVMPLIRMIYGETKSETRDRLMLAFNSPLFPEILVCSSVMGEGVDLHRFCRHVIHHDLCWNPSTLEQRTGRLDRVRCKAEMCHNPIEVYEPFLVGSADEKMFRVLRDRERWFQIVMGQKFEFDEGASEVLSSRVPLPLELGEALKFNLARWTVQGTTFKRF